MKAVVLAGGKGTRLGAISQAMPKPMVRIGPYPILEHQINLLQRYGIHDVVILTSHLSETIENHFGDGSARGLNITYSREPQPLGTTGGLKEIEEQLTDDFLVFYGDVMVDMNLDRLIDFHRRQSADCTLVLHPNDHPYDSDLVEVDETGRVVAFHAKPHEPGRYYRNMVNAAVYVMSPRVLGAIEKGVKADFGRNLFPCWVERFALYGYISAEYVKDVGTPERLGEVTRDYLSGKIARMNNEKPRPAIFLDRDGVINRDHGLIHRPEDFELLPGVAEAIKLINQSEYMAIVATNQPVVARNLCTLETLREIFNKMETELGRQRAKLDAIYYCPHHPDKGYPEENPRYKIACACRKPGTGMIEAAQKEYNLDLAHSFLVGDSWRDFQCGRAAGVTTVGVKTGAGGGLTDPAPDAWCDHLLAAVQFILDARHFKK